MFKHMNLKVLAILLLSLVFFAIAVTLIVSVSARKTGILAAKNDAFVAFISISQYLDKEDFIKPITQETKDYLKEMIKKQNVNNIVLVPKEDIAKSNFYIQKAYNEQQEVIEMIEVGNELITYTHLPYIEDGEVAGVVSIALNAIEFRHKWSQIIMWIFLCIVLFALFTMLLLKSFFAPYLLFYNDLKEVALEAEQGNFEKRITTTLQDEVSDIVRWINQTNEKIDSIIKKIETRIPILMHYQKERYSDSPLVRIREAVDELVDIYQLKKEIESFDNIVDIENAIVLLFQKMEAENLIIVEFMNATERIIYPTEDPLAFRKYYQVLELNNIPIEELRTLDKNATSSERQLADEFYPIDLDHKEGFFVIFDISNLVKWNILFTISDSQDNHYTKRVIPLLYNYFNIIRATLQNRYLLDILKENAQKDPLTQLNNRAFLEEFSQNVTFQAKRVGIDYAVMMIDIDYFKKVNDSYGHNIGDIVLQKLAMVFKETIRKSDLAVRYGGEEFLILLLSCSQEGATQVAQKIKENFESIEFESDLNEKFSCTLSVGVSLFPHDANSINLAIKYADIALYQAKANGRNQIVCFTKEIAPKELDHQI